MEKEKILWVDDEIDMLKPHILFLKEKGYDVLTANNGADALDILKSEEVRIVFLDEQMPGLSGLETLTKIKDLLPSLPVVMITKSEEEHIMEEAIGSKISDYLIKPVNPNQILLSLKKNLENKRLENEKSSMAYQQEFRSIGMDLSAKLRFDQWEQIYKKLVRWEIELAKTDDEGLLGILQNQKMEANLLFAKYIENNYINFVKGEKGEQDFEMSHTILRQQLLPLINDDVPVFFILIDNLRYDHWKIIQPMMEEYLKVISDKLYMSILPSVTHYARNSMFAGLMPSEIEKKYPQFWINEDVDDHKNQFEKDLLGEYLKRHGKDVKYTFNKVLNQSYGLKLIEQLPKMMNTPLNVIIYNFVDMLSHASTEIELLREMAADDDAYRSLVASWFEHSPLMELVKQLVGKKAMVVITTDHGSVRITDPVRVKGDRETSVNLRYKIGRNLEYDPKEVFAIKNPAEAYLPKLNITSSFIFCRKNDYFVYPNNYNQYVSYYKNTIQHGGISLEEMMIPYIVLQTK